MTKTRPPRRDNVLPPLDLNAVMNDIATVLPIEADLEPVDIRTQVMDRCQNVTLEMIDILAEIARDTSVKPEIRSKNAVYLIERVVGKIDIISTHKSMHVDMSADHLRALSEMSQPFIEVRAKEG